MTQDSVTRSLVGAIALSVPTLSLLGAPLLPVAAGAALAAFVVVALVVLFARPGHGSLRNSRSGERKSPATRPCVSTTRLGPPVQGKASTTTP